MTDIATLSPAVKLPIGATIAIACRAVVRHGLLYLAGILLWTIVAIFMKVGMLFGTIPIMQLQRILGLPYTANLPYWASLGLVIVAGGVSISTSCQRAILLGERPRFIDLLPYRRRHWRAIGIALALIVVTQWPYLSILLTLDLAWADLRRFGAVARNFFSILPYAMAFAGLWTLVSAPAFALALPMVAADRPRPLLRGAWHLARGNRLRLLACLACATLPFLIAAFLTQGVIMGSRLPLLTLAMLLGLQTGIETIVLLMTAILLSAAVLAAAHRQLAPVTTESTYGIFE